MVRDIALDLEQITVTTGHSAPRHAIIWLHGLGADGHDFESIVPELGLSEYAVRFIFPHAPYRRVTINAGMSMRAWYDITGPRLEDRQDENGIVLSAKQIQVIIEDQIAKGIQAENIILAGFSQGGAIALYSALTYHYPLCGVVALSTYLPLAAKADNALKQDPSLKAQAALTPILMVHGKQDPIVPIEIGFQSLEALKQMGCPVEWHTYPMQHSVCAQEITLISRWLRQRITGAKDESDDHR